MEIDPQRLALVLCDMQNDFLHPDGAYGRAGVTAAAITAVVPRLGEVADAVRSFGGWIVATQFTLVPGKSGHTFISPHLRELRPFLTRGDFAPGSFGQDVVAELQPVDLKAEKIAYDAFYMSRLDWMLRQAGIRTLVFGGIVTNGGVESSVRGAHVRGYELVVLEDGCAAFSQPAHDSAIASMATVAEISACRAIIESLKQDDD